MLSLPLSQHEISTPSDNKKIPAQPSDCWKGKKFARFFLLIFPFFNFNIVIPVSYTHLDVYKRQKLSSVTLLVIESDFLQGLNFSEVIKMFAQSKARKRNLA